MTSIESVTLEVADPTAASRFCTAAFGLDTQVRLRASETPTTGFRGFTLSLTVSQPSTVDSLIGTALDAGATTLKPAAKSGVSPEGSGSHRLMIDTDADPFTDPDGFAWQTASLSVPGATAQLDRNGI